ncbi:MAG: winged helix-turn-helix domain-containing protein [Nitrospiraceae bacterium]
MATKTTRRDFAALEKRRMEAARLLREGLSQADVARRVKVSRESVRRWQNQLTIHGSAEGLKKAGRAGRKALLEVAELRRLGTILQAGAEKAGFPNGLWTLERIAAVIRDQFQVDYHPGHVWWVLRRKLGWSCQRPVGRARERNEYAIRDWKENVWPALKKKPKPKVARSSS